MFYGNAQSIVAYCEEFIGNLYGILEKEFHLKSSFDKTETHF